jgi:adenylate cyclase
MKTSWGKYHYLLAPLGALVLCFPLLFSVLDNKIFDLFLRLVPSLTEDDRVHIITVDDASIEYAGGFPFPRDAMADAIILLKELGVGTIVFDLNYLDPSPARLHPDFEHGDFPRYVESPDEVLRDADAYFAEAIAFTDSTWLTLTFSGRGENQTAGSPPIAADRETFLKDAFSLDVDAQNDTLTASWALVMPAIPALLSRAKGAGFVNAGPDEDGYWRRVDLLAKYNGAYYGQLAFAALRNMPGDPSGPAGPGIEVSNTAITLRRALTGETRRDIVIPRAEDGSVLLKWPKTPFHDYRVRPLFDFLQYVKIESALVENFSLMENSGFFSYWDGETPPDKFRAASYLKELIQEERAYSELGTWRRMREDFFENSRAFLASDCEETILADSGDDTALGAYVQNLFRVCREQIGRMAEIRESAKELEGSFCVIGSDATSMGDTGLITFEELYPNVGTYAVLANMLLSGEFLDDAPRYVSFAAALVLCFGMALIIKRLSPGTSLAAGFLGLFLCGGAGILFFILTRRYIGMAFPLVSVTLTFLSLSGINFLAAGREKAFLHSAFSRYLSPHIINELIADPAKLNLGGEKREMTAVFTDIQGFSAISEKLDPVDLVRLLNIYLTEMSTIIMNNLGTIDKYEGDAIIAFFGAPVYREEHAALACRSAVMMKKAETELNKKITAEGLSPSPLFTRIGINTGEMVVGNMGAANKMDYTIMGNAVNLAARLEGVNKQYHTGGILISEYTKKQTGGEFVCRTLDRVRVVGIKTPVRLYEVLGLAEETGKEAFAALGLWEEALGYFEKKNFGRAVELFTVSARKGDGTAELYRGRCVHFLKNPPPPDWDGVFSLTEK